MAAILPQQISEEALPKVEAESRRIELAAMEQGGAAWVKFRNDVDLQQAFLEVFEKTFNISRSLKACGCDRNAYNRWRSTSYPFALALNDIIQAWYDDIYVSAAVRARGILLKDDTTESGFAEDAGGTPIYYDPDVSLTKMFLKAMHPEQFGDKLKAELTGANGADLFSSFAAAVEASRHENDKSGA